MARPVSEQIRIAKQVTAEATQQLIVRVAKTEHAKVMAAAPRPGSFRRIVDGREGAPEEAVRPAGVIVYEYPRIDLVGQFALETLIAKSPFGRPDGGHYRDDHVLLLNGLKVASFAGWKRGDEAVIANTRPYARKIEFGDMKMRVPGTDHVYAQAAQVVNRVWGGVARVTFMLIALDGRRAPALLIAEV